MTLILNPKYAALRDYLTHIEEHFEHEGHEIFRDRNVLRTLQVGDLTLCVKRYGRGSLRARLAVQLYKKSKGKKAYLRPLELRERGFESPEPVALVKVRKSLTRTVSYFVCLYSPYRYDLTAVCTLSSDDRAELISAFARYTARLHADGFMHRDFSPTNVLFDRVGGRYRFSLIDTNSLRTGRPVSLEKGCENLAALGQDEAFLYDLVDAYACERKVDAEVCRGYVEAARRR